MTSDRAEPLLPSGGSLLAALVRVNGWVALPAVAVVVICLLALLRLPLDHWYWFFGFIAVYALGSMPISIALQRSLLAPVAAWLDSRRERDVEPAFRAVMSLPWRAGLLGGGSWMAAGLFISLAMELRFASWSAFHWMVVQLSCAAAAFISGMFVAYIVKTRSASIREALAWELPDPARRGALVREVALRHKLFAATAGTTLVPVAFALLLTIEHTSSSAEIIATRWQARLLDELPDAYAPAALDALQGRAAAVSTPVSVAFHSLEESGGVLGAEAVAFIRSRLGKGQAHGDSLQLANPTIFTWRTLEAGRVVVAASPAADLMDGTRTPVTAFALLVLASTALVWGTASLIARDVSRATQLLGEESRRLASGDLRRGRIFESEDELGGLARAFDAMAQGIRATVSRVSDAADRVEATASRVSSVSESVTSVTADQVEGIERATTSMQEIGAQVRGIAASSRELAATVEDASGSAVELAATGEGLREMSTLLSSKMEHVTDSIGDAMRGVSKATRSSEALTEAAEDASASMAEMASSLHEVDGAAAQAVHLSEGVVASAERGHEKVRQTIEGMAAIQDATETAETVMRGLHRRSEEIGAVLDVIDDVADETNLLALNAAIIAAQAGEHGRAFSIVADEIKELAERVLASTKEIGSLIGSLQAEASNAIHAVERGAVSVSSGVDLSAEAGMALEEITSASR